MAVKTVDYTRGNPPKGRNYELTVEFRSGARYGYSGKTKTECIKKFKKRWGNWRGFVKKEWRFED